MHPSEAPTAIANVLWGGNGTIKARVYIRAHTQTVTGQTANGTPIFGAGYAEYEWEVTPALLKDPSISIERPRYAFDLDTSLRSVECTIELESQGGKLAAVQTGAILRRGDLEQARVILRAEVNGQIIDWFSGRISGTPKETAGVTTLNVVGSLWDCIRKPVLYENFPHQYTPKQSFQDAYYQNGSFEHRAAHINVIGSHFCAEHGIVGFDGGGRQYPNVRQSGGTGIALKQIGLKNGIKTGTYTITFLDAKNYTITYPDGQSFAATINGFLGYNATYNGTALILSLVGDIGIQPSFWEGSDGTDCTLEISVSWTASGNPIAIAFNLIEKALLDNWGALPTGAAWMDVVKWTEAARRFESFVVHVDATNKDNSVWEDFKENTPLSVASLAQTILNHVGCSLTMTIDGQISISIPYLDDDPTYPHDTTNTILGDGITIDASDDQFNYLTTMYAWNGDSYGAKVAPIDNRIGTAQKVEKVISFPYLKAGIGRRCAEWAAQTYARRFMSNQTTVSYKVHAGVGLLMQVGDRVTVVSQTLPLLTNNVEIFKISKSLGVDDAATVSAQIIQSHEGPKNALCTAVVGGAKIW
jgi:hypothetical protein